MSKLTDRINELVAPLAQKRGDELVEVEYVKEAKQNYLRIYVDRKPGGIDIEEIAALSEIVSQELDLLDPDPLPDPYVLELSSPGLERPIKSENDWQSAANEYIHVGLFQKLDGKKQFDGTLVDETDDTIKLLVKEKTRKKEIVIPKKIIANARFAIEF